MTTIQYYMIIHRRGVPFWTRACRATWTTLDVLGRLPQRLGDFAEKVVAYEPRGYRELHQAWG